MGRASTRCVLLVVPFALACGGSGESGVKGATPAREAASQDEPGVILHPLDDDGGAVEPPAPPEPGPVPALPDASKIETPPIEHSTQLWKDPLQLTTVDATPDAVFLGTHPGPENQGKLWTVPAAGGEPKLLLEGLGRIEDLEVGEGELFWLERALRPGAPYGIRAMPVAGGEPRTLYDGKLLSHGLSAVGDSLFWVLPVAERGTKGGLARIPQAGGELTEVGRDLGPVFAPRVFGDRLYFMAHRPDEPDVLYSVDAAGGDLQRHHEGPRGVIDVTVTDGHLYFLQLGPEGRSCSLMRVPRTPGVEAPQTLWTSETHIYERILADGGRLWVSTSPADPRGEVRVGPIDAKQEVSAWTEAPRVWRVFGSGAGPVFWYYERVVEDVLLREIGRLDPPE